MLTREARPDNGLNTAWDMVAEYTYDSTADGNHGLGRLTQSESVFDANDLPTVIDDITYDVLGRVSEATRTIEGTAYTTTSTTDSLGRILTMTLPTGEELTTTYNARGLFESLHGDNTFADDEYVTSTEYTPAGGIDAQTLGNGVMTDFRYDETSNRLARLLTGRPAFVPLVDQAYTYDSAGNITGLDDGVRDETNTYQYDFLNRLIYADVFAGSQMVERRMYAYDTIGNITSFRRAFPAAGEGTGFFKVGGLMDSAVYDARADFNPFAAMHRTGTAINGDGVSYFVTGRVGPNAAPVASGMRLQGSFYPGVYASSSLYEGPQSINPITGRDGVTAFARGVVNGGSGSGGYSGPYGEEVITYQYGENGDGPHAVTSRDISGTTIDDSFEYDENGNMTVRTQDGVTWAQTFNAENQLVSVSNGTTTTEYVYDGNGARIKKIVGNTTTLYVAGMEIETQDGLSGSKTTIYYPVGGAFRVIDTIADPATNEVYFRHSDHLGSTSVLSDFDGDKVANSDVVYAPFGEVRDGPESDLTDFGYTGQRRDDSTGGLMYYGARYYLPGVMRFISADTMTPGQSSQFLNRYSYVYNNPVNLIDPTGHAGGLPCKNIDGVYRCPPKPKPIIDDDDDDDEADGGGNGGGNGGGGGEEEPFCVLHDYSCYVRQHQIENFYTDSNQFDPDPCSWDNFLGQNCRNNRDAAFIIMHREEVLKLPRGREVWVGALTYYAGFNAATIMGLEGLRKLAGALGSEGYVDQAGGGGPMTDPVQGVLDETLDGAINESGNITSQYTLNADEALSAGEQWVGTGYSEVKDGVFQAQSGDLLFQFRIDNGSITGADGMGFPHFHLSVFEQSSSGNFLNLINNHVPLAP